jgi:tetratricopeptide (TPR) repeat protein
MARLAAGGALAVATLLYGRAAGAQEFVRQELLVAQFRSDTSQGLPAAGRELAQLTRDRLSKTVDKGLAHVVEGYRITNLLQYSDFSKKALLADAELRVLATQLRADETLFGRITRQDGAFVVTARIARLRNWGLQQPLPIVKAPTLAVVADQLVAEMVQARAQMTGLRRCENALLRDDRATAVREAERAIRAHPRATIARDCLMSALLDGQTAATTLLAIADTTLAIDSINTVAAVTRAQALEALKRTDAGAAWVRVYALHPDSLLLALTATEALLRVQQPEQSLRSVRALQARFGSSPELRRLAFRAHVALGQWTASAALGDTLERDDAPFRADSNYATRYIESLRQTGDTLAALEIGIRAVRRHPKDARIYLQYLQLINAEQPAALPRAISRFPMVSDFHLLAGNTARKSGNREAAIRATRDAVARDSTTLNPYLTLAEDYLQSSHPDSAALVLQRAPRGPDDRDRLRSYALARGVALLRAAGSDSVSTAQRAAVSLLSLADTLRSADDSRGVLAAAALQQARAQLIVAGRTRRCTDVEPFDGSLATASRAIEGGVGHGASADEIRSAYAALRASADAARKVLCKEPPPSPNASR